MQAFFAARFQVALYGLCPFLKTGFREGRVQGVKFRENARPTREVVKIRALSRGEALQETLMDAKSGALRLKIRGDAAPAIHAQQFHRAALCLAVKGGFHGKRFSGGKTARRTAPAVVLDDAQHVAPGT
jgi:hypothetical protein